MAPVLLIRAGTPQRKGFRNKLGEYVQIPVPLMGSGVLEQASQAAEKHFSDAKQKTTGFHSLRCNAVDAKLFLSSLFCQAQGKDQRSAKGRDVNA